MDKQNNKTCNDRDYTKYHLSILNAFGWANNDVDLIYLCSVYPNLVFNHLCMILAKGYDDAYLVPSHISKCPFVYIINPVGGKIQKISTRGMKSTQFKYFPAFRIKEDAVKAIQIARSIMKCYTSPCHQKTKK